MKQLRKLKSFVGLFHLCDSAMKMNKTDLLCVFFLVQIALHTFESRIIVVGCCVLCGVYGRVHRIETPTTPTTTATIYRQQQAPREY